MAVERMDTATLETVNRQQTDAANGQSPSGQLLSDELRAVFKSISPESCPRQANFHMHTVHSDGCLAPDELIQQALEIGLGDFAITDHHSIDGYREAKHCLERHTQQQPAQQGDGAEIPRLWVGVEVNAMLLDAEVHILCYAFDPDSRVMEPYLQGETVAGDRYLASSVIGAAHEAGGLVVLAHPDRYRRSPAELIPEAARLGIDGVETYYAYDNPSPWRPSPKQTAVVHQLGDEHHLLHTCGTDTHGLNLLTRL
ncbi:MAG: PHP domain-containing protein [Leptolyngbyaceae bacterium]|nr:PHP domain-containing protein [Leptolyngbyaceae bacterium]